MTYKELYSNTVKQATRNRTPGTHGMDIIATGRPTSFELISIFALVLLASLIPARRAASVNPIAALCAK
ncbi:MAG: hypothetical protein WBY75_19800 [Terracidiphilus sp.]